MGSGATTGAGAGGCAAPPCKSCSVILISGAIATSKTGERGASADLFAVARPEERKFLGFSISNDGSERRIAPKALDKFKGQIRDMTRRTRGFGLQQLIKELKPYIVGWRGYFGFCQTPRILRPRSVDPSKIAFVSLAAMANQAKPLRGVTPSRRSKVCRSGRSWFTNWALAHVRTSGGPTSLTQRPFRVAWSPESMRPPKPKSVEPPGNDPMPGGVGAVASRGVPLSDNYPSDVAPDRGLNLAPVDLKHAHGDGAQTKEGWRLPFRALVPRLDPTSS